MQERVPVHTRSSRVLQGLLDTGGWSSVDLVLEGWADPEEVFGALLADSENAFWLDAGVEPEGGRTYMGDLGSLGLLAIGDPHSRTVRVTRPSTGETASVGGDVFDVLDLGLRHRGEGIQCAIGWVGWMGYETGSASIGVAVSPGADSALLYADRLIVFDHQARRIRAVALIAGGRASADLAWLRRVEATIDYLSVAENPATAPGPAEAPAAIVDVRHSRSQYRRLVERCKAMIADGDAYQLCLTNQFTVPSSERPFDVYRRLRRLNPTPRGGFLTANGVALLASSPETFLQIDAEGQITCRPIKGTRRRGADQSEDNRLREELRTDEKERAENVMIVDLVRNDLTKVAELGSVEVQELWAVEAYENVLQLVSTIGAKRGPGSSTVDVIRSLFPAGSMTGAPKHRAVQILAALEQGPRGAYAGTFGFVCANGAVELTMTIRTIVMSQGIATLGAGGGITALSDPDREVEETYLKAAPLLAALGIPNY